MFDAEDVQHDLERFYQDDPEIYAAYEALRRVHHKKGLVYTEVAKSKTFNTVKYLVKEYPQGWISITDFDTGEVFAYGPPITSETTKPISDYEKVQKWLAAMRESKAA